MLYMWNELPNCFKWVCCLESWSNLARELPITSLPFFMWNSIGRGKGSDSGYRSNLARLPITSLGGLQSVEMRGEPLCSKRISLTQLVHKGDSIVLPFSLVWSQKWKTKHPNKDIVYQNIFNSNEWRHIALFFCKRMLTMKNWLYDSTHCLSITCSVFNHDSVTFSILVPGLRSVSNLAFCISNLDIDIHN